MESPKAYFYDGCCWVDDDLLWAFRDIVVGTYVVRCLLAHVCVAGGAISAPELFSPCCGTKSSCIPAVAM